MDLNQDDSQDQEPQLLAVDDTKKVARPFSDWASSFFKIIGPGDIPITSPAASAEVSTEVSLTEDATGAATADGATTGGVLARQDLTLPSYFEPPIKDPPSGFTLLGFLQQHEQTLFWLWYAIAMTMLACWFLNTHGYVELSDAALNKAMFDATRFAPLAGIWMLFSRSLRRETPWLAAFTFISIIFVWPLAALTAVVVLFSRFNGISRGFSLLILIIVQLLCLLPISQHETVHIEAVRNTGTHRVILERTAGDLTLLERMEHRLREEIAVTPWFKFVKVHCRIFDHHAPAAASIIPVDPEHVVILINRHSHYDRTFVDLSRKNKPISQEYLER